MSPGMEFLLLKLMRIIEPLASRCAKFRFKALDPINTKQRIEFIAEQEHVNMEDGVLPLKQGKRKLTN